MLAPADVMANGTDLAATMTASEPEVATEPMAVELVVSEPDASEEEPLAELVGAVEEGVAGDGEDASAWARLQAEPGEAPPVTEVEAAGALAEVTSS